jgi:hypothetical protein
MAGDLLRPLIPMREAHANGYPRANLVHSPELDAVLGSSGPGLTGRAGTLTVTDPTEHPCSAHDSAALVRKRGAAGLAAADAFVAGAAWITARNRSARCAACCSA